MTRIGDWMQTAHGRQFWPLDPRAEEVHLDDIAHSLAHQCRFAGHCLAFYSVAQHSVYVSELVPAEDALWGLMHDASEAYLVDLPRPVKRSPGVGPAYAIAETAVMHAVCDRFGLSRVEPANVKIADARVLMAEARDLMSKPPQPWQEIGYPPMADRVTPWSPVMAREWFLNRFAALTADAPQPWPPDHATDRMRTK